MQKNVQNIFNSFFYSSIPVYNEIFNIQTQIMLLVLYGNDEKLGKYQKRGISFRQSQISKSVK